MSPGPALVAAALLLAGVSGPASAQEPRLGDVARREQARRAQAPRAPRADAHTYTNDDLESIRGSEPRGNLNVIGTPAGEASRPPSREGAVGEEGPAPVPASGALQGEDDWRRRAASLRSAMDGAQQRLQAARAQADGLRERLSPVAQVYLQDVNERLRLQSELTAAETEMGRAQAELEQARQAFRELQAEAQRQRVPPGWISAAP